MQGVGSNSSNFRGPVFTDWGPLSIEELRGYSMNSNISNSSSKADSNRISRNVSQQKHENFFRKESVVDGKTVILCLIPNCGYQSDKNSNFKRHFETMHYLLDPPIECCGSRFLTKWEFRHHSKSVHYEGHRCSQCQKLFNRKALLERHNAIHTGTKPYKCSKCDYASANKANVSRHLSIHKEGEAWVEFEIEGDSHNQFAATPTTPTDDSFSLSSSLLDSSSERIGDCSSQVWRDSSFCSTRTSSPCSIATLDNDKQSYSFEDLILINPETAVGSDNPKKGRISHSIDSILGRVCSSIKKTSRSIQGNTTEATVLPEDTRKLKVGTGQENWARINEETNTNWSHLSPQPMSLQNPSPSSATPTLQALLSSQSSSAAVQQFLPSACEEMIRNQHNQYYSAMTYPYPYHRNYFNNETVVSHNGNQVTPPELRNKEKIQEHSFPIVTSLNQDSRLISGFLPDSCHNNKANRNESFVSKKDLIHLVPTRAGIKKKGADYDCIYGGSGGGDCYKGIQEKISNNWDNSSEFTDSKKRVHEKSFVNEGTPVPPQKFVNGNGLVEDDHYVPKKLRLSKKRFRNLSP